MSISTLKIDVIFELHVVKDGTALARFMDGNKKYV